VTQIVNDNVADQRDGASRIAEARMSSAELRYQAVTQAARDVLGEPFASSRQDGRRGTWPALTWHGARGSIMLVNNSTDASWWQAAARASSAICLPRGRLAWLDGRSPLQGQTVLYFGAEIELFRARFIHLGAVRPRTI
jgi:hypothetical protein